MKEFKKGLFLTLLVFLGVKNVSAASGSISVTSNSKSVVVGSTFKVTTKVSSSELGAWEYCISYDSNLLKLESSTANSGNCVKAGVIGQTGQTETWTFKALKSGTSKVTVRSFAVYSIETEDQMSINAGSVSITAKTQAEIEASYSKNNNLKSLGVEGYTLSPEFNKDTKEYTVDVPSEVTKINITASPEDNKSSIKGIGEFEVVEGSNLFEIVVTAQNGNTNTYKVNVNVEDKNPIEVQYDGTTYSVVKRASLLTAPEGFNETSISIGESSVPAFYNELTKVTLVGLKDTAGNISLFKYDDGEYIKYVEFKFSQIIINQIEMDKKLLPKGYKKYTVMYDEEEIEVYKFKKDSDYALIYGVDVSTGDKALYQVDLKNKTIQEYNDELFDFMKELDKKNLLIYGTLGGVILLEFLIILISRGRRRKLLSKVKKDKVEKVKSKAINDAKKETVKKETDNKKKSEE